MAGKLRSRSPDPRWMERDIEARFAVLDHFHAHGLVSEAVEHILLPPGWCCCTRCRYFEDQDDAR